MGRYIGAFLVLVGLGTALREIGQAQQLDSEFQATRYPQLHGYWDSTRFQLHAFTLGEMILKVVLDSAQVVAKPDSLQLSGRVTDERTGELVASVIVAMGPIDTLDPIARIYPTVMARTTSEGEFNITGRIREGTWVSFSRPGYLVQLYHVFGFARKHFNR